MFCTMKTLVVLVFKIANDCYAAIAVLELDELDAVKRSLNVRGKRPPKGGSVRPILDFPPAFPRLHNYTVTSKSKKYEFRMTDMH